MALKMAVKRTAMAMTPGNMKVRKFTCVLVETTGDSPVPSTNRKRIGCTSDVAIRMRLRKKRISSRFQTMRTARRSSPIVPPATRTATVAAGARSGASSCETTGSLSHPQNGDGAPGERSVGRRRLGWRDMSELQIPVGDGGVDAYLAVPPVAGGPWPAVVVVHDAFGLTDVTREHADHLAAAGYLAVVPDLYTR